MQTFPSSQSVAEVSVPAQTSLAQVSDVVQAFPSSHATVLAVFLVPVFFVVVRRVFKGSERQRRLDAAHEHETAGPAA